MGKPGTPFNNTLFPGYRGRRVEHDVGEVSRVEVTAADGTVVGALAYVRVSVPREYPGTGSTHHYGWVVVGEPHRTERLTTRDEALGRMLDPDAPLRKAIRDLTESEDLANRDV